ncbi:MAG: 4a-hydroxytetrahydrobiopterin dehydratase [Burkholderiales bacterium]|nr:4a-hydroxytetrahydrobiopterin dehydratase [Phycisphaerae bacterium]
MALTKLTPDEIAQRLPSAPDWAVDKTGALHREFRFVDFPRAFGFMASVATVAQAMDHHPDWSNVYNRVTIRLSTHDAGGLTEKDFELAKRIDELVRG